MFQPIRTNYFTGERKQGMKWRIQFILLVTLMSCFVIGGIHLAEKGTQRVDGAWGSSQSFNINRADSGSLEMTVLGKSYSIEDEGIVPFTGQAPVESGNVAQDTKQEHNLFSAAGNTFGGWLSGVAKKVVTRFQER
jgi:hypothetical protein